MRTKHAMNNIVYSFLNNLITSVFKFVVQMVFIKTLGIEYLGINSFLTNVVAILSLTELGITNAISYSLYKPLSEKNEKKITQIINFYRKIYSYIALITFAIGLIILFLLKYMVETSIPVYELNIVFAIFVAINLVSYLFGYKRTLIVADQKNYQILPYMMLTSILLSISQILILIFTKNYIFFVLVILLYKIIENYLINKIVDQKYAYVKNVDKNISLDNEDYSEIKKNVKAMILHKIGEVSINSTDNIIIATGLSVVVVGVYSNYYMIIAIVLSFIVTFFTSMTASIGNLIVDGSRSRQIEVFYATNFLSFWIMTVSGILLFELLNPFMMLWLNDSSLLLKEEIIFVLIINFYFVGTRLPLSTTKMAAGIYDEDKFVPIIQSIINLTLSIILIKYIGLMGVFIGTLISSLYVAIVRPILVFKYVFYTSPKKYFCDISKYFLVFLISLFLISGINNLLWVDGDWLNFVLKASTTFIITNIIILTVFFKNLDFKEVIRIIKKALGKNE